MWRAALLLGISALLVARAAPLRIATGELPPYATAERSDQGLALAIVRRAFELGGHAVEFHFMPWSRAQLETQGGQWDASAHWGATPERRENFLLSDNLLTEDWVFVYRRSLKDFSWRTAADLRPYRIGLVRDYTYTPEIWALARSGQIKSGSPPNDLAGLKMLLLDRIQVFPTERRVACDLASRHLNPEQQAELIAHPKRMTDNFTTHVLFPKGKPASDSLRLDFNRGLAQLRASPEYRQLLQVPIGCPAGLMAKP
ncbi:substrate-binding periplasmic protein [Inhella gelatinilytica]|nr:transporter substrate-binding domain-containing protein [Inhella gelatinilytica]